MVNTDDEIDANEPSTSIAIKKKKNRKCVELPEAGILNYRGHLFHQYLPHFLTDKHYKRLEEHGITISKKEFSKKEDDIIIANWKSFALTYDLPDNKAAHYAGLDVGRDIRNMTERQLFLRKTFFYPKMCKGLDHRTASQIESRIQLLFDPMKLEGNDEKDFSSEADNLLLELYAEHRSPLKVAKAMRKPVIMIKARIKYFKLKAKRGENMCNMAVWAALGGVRNTEPLPARLPQEGILNEDGHLFHHAEPKLLYKRHIQRLMEHNIVPVKGAFSKEEDDQLHQNWLEFAQEFELPEKSAAWFAGYGSKTRGPGADECLVAIDLVEGAAFGELVFSREKDVNSERLLFVRGNHFWARMCRGLYSRTAFSVRNRILINYDPVKCIEDCTNTWSEEDDHELLRLYKIHRSSQKVSQVMHKPFISVWGRMQLLLRRSIDIRTPELRTFWAILDRKLSGGAQLAVKETLARNAPNIDWKEISFMMARSVSVVENAWKYIIENVSSKLETLDLDSAINEVVPAASFISGAEFSDFIELLRSEFHNMEIIPKRLHHDERMRLEDGLLAMGVSGFYSGRYTELSYCLKRLRSITNRVSKRLIDVLNFPLSQDQLLSVISLAYRRMPSGHGKLRHMPLTSKLLVVTLLEYMQKNHPTWLPPRKLIKYAKKEQISIFSLEKEEERIQRQNESL